MLGEGGVRDEAGMLGLQEEVVLWAGKGGVITAHREGDETACADAGARAGPRRTARGSFTRATGPVLVDPCAGCAVPLSPRLRGLGISGTAAVSPSVRRTCRSTFPREDAPGPARVSLSRVERLASGHGQEQPAGSRRGTGAVLGFRRPPNSECSAAAGARPGASTPPAQQLPRMAAGLPRTRRAPRVGGLTCLTAVRPCAPPFAAARCSAPPDFKLHISHGCVAARTPALAADGGRVCRLGRCPRRSARGRDLIRGPSPLKATARRAWVPTLVGSSSRACPALVVLCLLPTMSAAYSQLPSDAADAADTPPATPHGPSAAASAAAFAPPDGPGPASVDGSPEGAEATEAWKQMTPWARFGIYVAFGLLGAGVLLPLSVLRPPPALRCADCRAAMWSSLRPSTTVLALPTHPSHIRLPTGLL